MHDEDYRTTDSESTDNEMRNDETRHADGPVVIDPNATPRPAKPKSDPRLWMYRYKSPPRQGSTTSRLSSSSPRSPTYQIPLYNEGTVLRITGKIFLNTARGNERQIEASTVEAVYEPEHRIGRKIVKETGNKYAEWHHNLKCKRKRLDFKDREKVRELIGFISNQSNPVRDGGQSMISVGDVTMLNVTLVSRPLPDGSIFADSIYSLSHLSTTL